MTITVKPGDYILIRRYSTSSGDLLDIIGPVVSVTPKNAVYRGRSNARALKPLATVAATVPSREAGEAVRDLVKSRWTANGEIEAVAQAEADRLDGLRVAAYAVLRAARDERIALALTGISEPDHG